MSIVETVLIFAVIPLAIYGFIALLTLRSKIGAAPKYRPGQQWDHPPIWWSANPEGVAGRVAARETASGGSPEGASSETARTRGGASGSW